MLTRRIGLAGIALLGILTGCGESPVQTPASLDDVEGPQRPPLRAGAPKATPTAEQPSGIGGAYTMTAGGEKITQLSVAPTGIELPPGVPVRVRVSGAITRAATTGLKEFCALDRWVSSCEGVWADIVAEDPIPPSGPSFWPGAGAALVAWDGDAGSTPPEGSRVALTGPSGSEMWAGRSEWGCYYFDSQEIQGPCFTFGGGYTVTVEADDGGSVNDTADAGGGGGGGSSDAELTATASLAGGGVHLLAVASDGSTVGDPSWTFIPDEFTTVNGDTTAPAAASPSSTAAPGTPDEESVGMEGVRQVGPQRWRLPDGRLVGPGLYVVRRRAPAAVTRAAGSSATTPFRRRARLAPPSAAPMDVDECSYLADCYAPVPPASGTYIVVATVNGSQLSASARVGDEPRATLSVTCDPANPTRGELITCKAQVDPESASLEVTAWHFVGGGYERDRTFGPTAEWAGKAVVGGTVSVEATVDGKPLTAGTQYTVEARNWTIPTDVTEVAATSLPPRPTVLHDLGQIGMTVDINDKALGFEESGPNPLIAYWKTDPLTFVGRIEVNRDVLKRGSDFWYGQIDATHTLVFGQACTRNDVVQFIPVILRHEGDSMDPHSHAGLYYQKLLDEHLSATVEGFTGAVNSEVLDPTQSAVDAVRVKAVAESDRADHEFAPRYCTFNYNYPSRKQGGTP